MKKQLAATKHGSPEWHTVKSLISNKWKAAELFTSGLEEYEKAHYQAALRNLEASSELDPTSEVFGNLGVVYRSLARYEEALAAFNESERLRKEQGLPDHPSIVINRGVVYRCQGHYEDALAAYDKAEGLRKEQGWPDDPSLAHNRGETYRKLKQFDRAEDYYKQAEKLRKTLGLHEEPMITFDRGQVHFDQGDTEGACKLTRKARDM